jgi:hypothetical protein
MGEENIFYGIPLVYNLSISTPVGLFAIGATIGAKFFYDYSKTYTA